MHAFCLRSDDLDGFAATARTAGIGVPAPVAMSRTRADGVRLDWRVLYLDSPDWGPTLPFLIDWQASPHPSDSVPGGCGLLDFTVLHPRANDLKALFSRLEIEVPVALAPLPGFLLRLDTPNGALVLV